MYKDDPDLKDHFMMYYIDNLIHGENVTWTNTYIHWHPSVSEYCVYINDKWSGYVPEEYIFKAGFELYKQWSDAWIRSSKNEMYYDLTRRYMQTCLEFCKEKDNSESSRMDCLRWFVRVVRHHRVLPKDIQDQALEYMHDWCTNNNFTEGAELLEKELENGMAEEAPQRRNRKIRSED